MVVRDDAYVWGSKTCDIPFARELSRRVREEGAWGRNVRVDAVHPGNVATELNTGLRDGWTKRWELLIYALVAVSIL